MNFPRYWGGFNGKNKPFILNNEKFGKLQGKIGVLDISGLVLGKEIIDKEDSPF